MRAFLWRLFHAHNDKITPGGFWYYMCSREMAFLPAVGLFSELAIGIINVNGYLCLIDFRAKPEPVFVGGNSCSIVFCTMANANCRHNYDSNRQNVGPDEMDFLVKFGLLQNRITKDRRSYAIHHHVARRPPSVGR